MSETFLVSAIKQKRIVKLRRSNGNFLSLAKFQHRLIIKTNRLSSWPTFREDLRMPSH